MQFWNLFSMLLRSCYINEILKNDIVLNTLLD